MTEADLKAAIIECLAPIAPEADPARLDPEANIRESLDIDSYDFLQFLIALSRRLGIEVPEADYARLATMKGLLAYLGARLQFPEKN